MCVHIFQYCSYTPICIMYSRVRVSIKKIEKKAKMKNRKMNQNKKNFFQNHNTFHIGADLKKY